MDRGRDEDAFRGDIFLGGVLRFWFFHFFLGVWFGLLGFELDDLGKVE